MLDAALQQQLRSYFANITRPVTLTASLDDSDGAREMKTLLEEVAALSDNITLKLDGTDQRRPSFRVEPSGIRFAAVPLGHELSSFVLALLQAGTRARLRRRSSSASRRSAARTTSKSS